MAEKHQKNPEKTPEKFLPKPGKPRRIREVQLRIQELLIVYVQPVTLKELSATLAGEGITVSPATVREILTLYANTPEPIPGYTLQVSNVRVGEKKVNAFGYKLIKICRKKHTSFKP